MHQYLILSLCDDPSTRQHALINKLSKNEIRYLMDYIEGKDSRKDSRIVFSYLMDGMTYRNWWYKNSSEEIMFRLRRLCIDIPFVQLYHKGWLSF